MRFVRLAVALVTAVILVACSDSTGSSTGGHGNTITVSNDFFSPTPDTATAGLVTFTWSNASHSHNVTWDTGPTMPANSTTKTSGTHPVTLSQGTYTYHCTVHPTVMHGTIVVQ